MEDGNVWCRTKQVCQRYNGIVPRTVDRWVKDPELNFPKPKMINGRRYWRLTELEQWERARAART